MLQKYKDKREEGFTIIEVLIVLAIAGLIILIVFLAVPALQRNSRNTQRTNDASLIAASVNECLNNNNGQPSSCDTLTKLEDEGVIDTTKVQQLTTISVSSTAPSAPSATEQNNANVGFSARCNTEADDVDAASTRSFAILYRVEGTGSASSVRCVGS